MKYWGNVRPCIWALSLDQLSLFVTRRCRVVCHKLLCHGDDRARARCLLDVSSRARIISPPARTTTRHPSYAIRQKLAVSGCVLAYEQCLPQRIHYSYAGNGNVRVGGGQNSYCRPARPAAAAASSAQTVWSYLALKRESCAFCPPPPLNWATFS